MSKIFCELGSQVRELCWPLPSTLISCQIKEDLGVQLVFSWHVLVCGYPVPPGTKLVQSQTPPHLTRKVTKIGIFWKFSFFKYKVPTTSELKKKNIPFQFCSKMYSQWSSESTWKLENPGTGWPYYRWCSICNFVMDSWDVNFEASIESQNWGVRLNNLICSWEWGKMRQIVWFQRNFIYNFMKSSKLGTKSNGYVICRFSV